MQKKINRKIGLLGGTFDPIHEGHLTIAKKALEMLSLDHIEFIPCFLPPHRSAPQASVKDRLAMLQSAIQDHQKFFINDMEIKRKGVSYTIDTLMELHRLHPDFIFYLIIGADEFSQFHTWKNNTGILKLVHLVVVRRNDIHLDVSNKNVTVLDMEPIFISASHIQEKIASGEKNITGLPKVVEQYIQKHHLYR